MTLIEIPTLTTDCFRLRAFQAGDLLCSDAGGPGNDALLVTGRTSKRAAIDGVGRPRYSPANRENRNAPHASLAHACHHAGISDSDLKVFNAPRYTYQGVADRVDACAPGNAACNPQLVGAQLCQDRGYKVLVDVKVGNANPTIYRLNSSQEKCSEERGCSAIDAITCKESSYFFYEWRR
jgi:hypothetical protein